jgi:hypothetical protein
MFVRNTKRNVDLVRDLHSLGMLRLAVLWVAIEDEGYMSLKLVDGQWAESTQYTPVRRLEYTLELIPNWDSSDIVEAIDFD